MLLLLFLLGAASVSYGFSGVERPACCAGVFHAEWRYSLKDTTSSPKLRPLPVPKKAWLYSLILPGAGQIYNGHWWKTPFVYGALGYMVNRIAFNQNQYKTFNDAYVLALRNEPNEFPGVAVSTLRVFRDRFDKRRQLSYIGLVAAYGLQSIEALVDAHLQNFDVDEDLSIRVKPSLGIPGPGGMAPGISFTLRLH